MSKRAILTVIGAAALARAAHASPPASSLSWTRMPGAEACIDAPELARAVEAKIGEVLVTPSHADLSIEGRIAPRRGGGWRAVVAISHAGGGIASQRTLETKSASCRVLDTPLALVIALLVDPEGSPPVPPPAATPEVVIKEVRVEVPVPVPVLVHDPWHVAVATRGEGELGVLSRASVAGALAIAVHPPGVPRIELAGFYALAQHVETDLPDRTVTETFLGGSIAVCPGLALGPVRGLACGGARLARFAWTGHGFEQDMHDAVLVPALGLDGRIEVPLGRGLGLVAGAGVRVPLREVHLRYERSAAAGGGEVTIDDAAPVSLWVGLGVFARVM